MTTQSEYVERCIVYVMKRGSNVKVGISKDPWRRRSQLASEKGKPYLVKSFEYSSREKALIVERTCLRQFKSYRASGEWFRGLAAEELVAFIIAHAPPGLTIRDKQRIEALRERRERLTAQNDELKQEISESDLILNDSARYKKAQRDYFKRQRRKRIEKVNWSLFLCGLALIGFSLWLFFDSVHCSGWECGATDGSWIAMIIAYFGWFMLQFDRIKPFPLKSQNKHAKWQLKDNIEQLVDIQASILALESQIVPVQKDSAFDDRSPVQAKLDL